MTKARFLALACLYAAFLLCVKIETMFFTSSIQVILRLGPWMAAMIFMHNMLAAGAVALSMLFLVCTFDVVPERHRWQGLLVLKHSRAFSAFLAVLVIATSAFALGPPNISASVIPKLILVGAIEAYGLYLAALAGLHRSISARSWAEVSAVFAAGAVLETLFILYT
ncbi:MAG: hypothetical protein QXT50_00975 [Thermofilum sp.]